jgi:hypothetical protein
MKQLKYILPLLLTIITLSIYNPIQAEASTSNYSITFYQDVSWTLTPDPPYNSTNKIPIIQHEITLNGQWMLIKVWNNNTILGHISPSFVSNYGWSTRLFTVSGYNVTLTLPSNATHFSLVSYSGNASGLPNISFATFQQTTVSYTNPAPTGPVSIVLPSVTYIEPYGFGYNASNTIELNAGQTFTEAGVIFNTGSLVNIDNFTIKNTSLGNTAIAGLTPSTTYYYRTFITMDGVTFYSTTAQFTTTAVIDPIVPTPTYSITPNLVATILFPAHTNGNNESATGVGWAWTNNGTTPTKQNTLSLSPFNVNSTEVSFTLDYSTTYKFVKYIDTNANRTIYSDVLTFTTPNPTFNVIFKDYDGTTLATRTVSQGESVTDLPPNPTRQGYTFSHWEPPVTNIQGNLETFAQYTINTYLVTFIADGLLIGQQNVAHGSGLNTSTIPIPTKQGFTFQHYRYVSNGINIVFNINTDVITAPLELIAVFADIPTYTITWRDPAFNVLKIETVNSGLTGTPPNYVPNSGFTLVGWTPDITQPVTQNIQYIAIVQEVTTNSGTTPIVIQNATGLTDLFAGVFGAIVGSLMILGTIDLFGLQLSSLLWLFFAGTGFMLVWKIIRG